MLFGWIPIIGPIIDGIVSIWKGHQQLESVKYTVDGKVDVAAIEASTKVIEATRDDIGTSLARDVLIFPWALYGGITGWDYLMANRFPELVWSTAPVPEASGLAYLPYMVFVYLLGAVGLNIWRRK
jgi:hypothetical protein